jgi:hypothetical protein
MEAAAAAAAAATMGQARLAKAGVMIKTTDIERL